MVIHICGYKGPKDTEHKLESNWKAILLPSYKVANRAICKLSDEKKKDSCVG